jgi:hypothetical protein
MEERREFVERFYGDSPFNYHVPVDYIAQDRATWDE